MIPNDKKIYSCIGIRYAKLFEATEIPVQIMRFTRCLKQGFHLTKPIWALICLHNVTQERIAALTDNFADALVCENVGCVYDVVATL